MILITHIDYFVEESKRVRNNNAEKILDPTSGAGVSASY